MDTQQFIQHFKAAAEFLSEHKDEVNRLNVFPVPDGDTGTNMSLTIMSVVKELEALPPGASLAEARKAVTHGSLMGARGNSGVITSQVLRGFCEGLEGAVDFDAPTLARALAKAVEVSYAAVRRPVEGTILTVVKDMALASERAAQAGLDSLATMKLVVDEAFASVQRTPELLPVLKENGVVDAGGYGLALLVLGYVSSAVGEPPTAVAPGKVGEAVAEGLAAGGAAAGGGPVVAIEQINDWEGSDYLYCTEFLLNSEGLDVAAALQFLSTMGDCELLVGSHPSFKVHVHTDEPGLVIGYMTERGQVHDVHIHNMRLQSEQRSAELAGEDAPPKRRGYIAVASGSGMQRILESLGVDVIVNGGQTMNPSTAELLQAIEAVNADEVIVFPNNKNIIMAAQAAADVAGRPVAVVPTRSVPESFSAMFLANADQSLEQEVAEMSEAIGEVHAAEVTHAIKDATSVHGQAIKAGDVIGIAGDAIEVVGSDVGAVALELVGCIANDDCDTLTLLAGEQLGQADFEAIVEQVEAGFPDLEVDARRGEQPLYPLIMAVE